MESQSGVGCARQTITVAARLLSQEHHVETPMPSRDLRPRSQNSYSISYYQDQETWFY